MGRHLEKAFAEAATLPEDDQQAIAALALAELDSERKLDDVFA